MLALQPYARLIEIADAGHDLHLDQPVRWRAAVAGFLSGPLG
jgi:pimeloyl-ACP methyl ester carboxylesterase